MTIAIYPGSFDPLTNGHVSIIKRGLTIFDHVVVAIARNSAKSAAFSIEDRLKAIRKTFAEHPGVEATHFEGLLIDYARSRQAKVLLRGLRAVSDFEYELMMASMNSHLDNGIETLFMMTESRYFYVSSKLVKEVAALKGSVCGLVPDISKKMLNEKYGKPRSSK